MALYIRECGEEDLAVAGTLTRLGGIYLTLNQFEKAEQSFQKALHIRKSKLGTAHWKVAKTLTMMVNFYERTRKPELAVECGNQALKIGEDEFGPDAINLTPVLVALGRILMSQQKFDEAKMNYKRALKIAEEKVGQDHPTTAEIVYELGCFFFVKPEELGARVKTDVAERFKQRGFWENRDYSRVTLINKKEVENEENAKGWSKERAEKLFLRALTVIENTVGTEHPDYARILNRLGSLYIERVQFLKAEEYLLKALEIRLLKFGALHSRVAQTYKHLYTLYNLQEKLEQSRDCAHKALEVLRYLHGEKSIEVSNIYERIGDQCAVSGLRDEAKQYFFKAKTIRVSLLGEDHKDTLAIVTLINGLIAPPPPPPPPPMTIAVEDLYSQANVEITTEMKAQKGRDQLLDAIKNFGKMKEQLASAENKVQKQKKAHNLEEKKGWWKQNYKAGFDAANVAPKKISASMLKDKKEMIMKPQARVTESKRPAPPPTKSDRPNIPPPPPNPMRK
jgi:tetratricopeptide (TPR) repeat protein